MEFVRIVVMISKIMNGKGQFLLTRVHKLCLIAVPFSCYHENQTLFTLLFVCYCGRIRCPKEASPGHRVWL